MEYEDQRVVEGVHIQTCHEEGCQGRVQEQYDDIRCQRFMGELSRGCFAIIANSLPQHGVAPGYYLTFLFGGFVTTVARLARSSIRPLLIPIPGAYQPASPRFAKRVYDLLGILLSILLTNYAAGPFMLGTLGRSFESFSRLAWYGYVIVLVGLVFFYGGGTRTLKKMQATRIRKAEDTKKAVEESRAGSESPGGSHVMAPVHFMAEEVMRELEKQKHED